MHLGYRSIKSLLLLPFLFAAPAVSAVELVVDGGFEQSLAAPSWGQQSTNFGSPHCHLGICRGVGARTGIYWMMFGDAGVRAETATIWQRGDILPGEKILQFYIWWSTSVVNPPDPNAVFRVRLDNATLFTLTPATAAAYSTAYTPVSIDVSSLANGFPRTLWFEWTNAAASASSTLNLDDVRIVNNRIFANGFEAPTPAPIQ